MQNIGLILLVFSFVIFCIAAWVWAPSTPNWYRLIAAGLAFLVAAFIFGGLSAAHLLGR